MTKERQRRIREVFDAACEVPQGERAAFVLREAAGDQDLCATVSRLLAARSRSGGLLDTPSWGPRDGRAAPLEIGSRIGPYKILRELEAGGMGIVYQVVRADSVFHRVSALKIVRPEFAGDSLLGRFRKEREILALLDHNNIARIVDGGSTPAGLPYFVMDFVDGAPIDAFCRQNLLTVSQRMRIFAQACVAAQYLHDHNVVHSDFKPSNMLVTNEGVVKILDFGIAGVLRSSGKEAGAGASFPLMTPEYASPEQLGGGQIGPRSDIYSLGVVLYELLTGTRPYSYEGVLPKDMRRVIETTPPLPPSTALAGSASHGIIPPTAALRDGIDKEVDAIVLRAISRDPDTRYGSGSEFRRDIENYLSCRPVAALHGKVFYRSRKFARRNVALVSASAVITALLALVGWQTAELRRRWDRSNVDEKAAIAVQQPALESLKAAATQLSHSGQHLPRDVEFDQLRQSQLLQVHNLGEAYRTSFAEAVRLRPGMTPSRRNLVDQADKYLRQAEAFVRDDPTASEQLALAWLWIAKIQGDPGNANLGDPAGATASVREAERVIANSSSPRARALLNAIRRTAKDIEQGRNLKPEI